MPKTFNPSITPLMRCPIGGNPLSLSVFEENDAGVQTGALVARDSRYVYPIIDGTPVLLCSPGAILQEFFSQWASDPRFPNNINLPPMAQNQGSEIEHYELNGIEIIESDPFEASRRSVSLSLIPDDAESLLEIGTGPGVFLAEIEKMHPGIAAMGIERSGACIRATRCVSPIYQAEANRLPFTDHSFQCLVSMKTLEHLPCGVYEAALEEMIRVADQYIVINVPHNERRLQSVCPSCNCAFNSSYHMRSFDDRVLEKLFPGFDMIKRIELPRYMNLISALAAPFRRRVFDGFVDYGICPQCGYRKHLMTPASQGMPTPSRFHAIIRRIANGFPKVATRGDIILLYKRQAK